MKKLITLAAMIFAGYVASAQCSAHFTTTITGLSVNFNNTSTPPSHTGAMTKYANWNFGDASYSSSWSPSHTYSSSGVYPITLLVEWVDSATSSYVCSDTLYDSVFVSSASYTGVSGSIIRDSALGTVSMDSIWVWLITYDTTSHIIKAVDSQAVAAFYEYTSYSFHGVTPGSYLVKAASMFGSSGSGFVPTYHDSSLHWNTASYATVTSGSMTTGTDIYMQYGTVPSGPGFIGGDVTAGAGKGTAVGDPVPGVTMYLINSTTGKLVSVTTTDASGKYSFNVPYGAYNISPEKAPLTHTDWASITVSTSSKIMDKINFTANSKTIVPNTTGINTIETTQLAIYPNPAKGKININWNGNVRSAEVNITDITGKNVYHSIMNVNSTTSQVNISALQQGVYIINVTTENNNYKQKLIVE
jgi:hypothetical protein